MKTVWLLFGLLRAGPLRGEGERIQGLLVDNTISHVGHDFYRHFADRLTDTTDLDCNLVVCERPSARWGSLVWGEHEQRLLYHQFIPPNNSELKDAAYTAADQVHEGITRWRLENLLQDTSDMDKDELGTRTPGRPCPWRKALQPAPAWSCSRSRQVLRWSCALPAKTRPAPRTCRRIA